MTVRFIDSGWSHELRDALKADNSLLRIVSPFIKRRAAEELLALKPKRIEVITRFSLADFANGVSDIDALASFLDSGAIVRGIRNLHSKLYVVGATRAIITSANLTAAGFARNLEFGIVSNSVDVLSACRTYFDALWRTSLKLNSLYQF